MIASTWQLLDLMDGTTTTTTTTTTTSTNDGGDDVKNLDPHHHHPLVVIMYHAKYCKICQRAGIQFKKIASEHDSGSVRFAKVEASVLGTAAAVGPTVDVAQQQQAGGPPKTNGSSSSSSSSSAASVAASSSSDTLRCLGVTKFPFVQIYRQGNCVASFSTGPSHMFVRKVRDTLGLCLDRSASASTTTGADAEWDRFFHEYHDEIVANRRARERLRSELRPDREGGEEDWNGSRSSHDDRKGGAASAGNNHRHHGRSSTEEDGTAAAAGPFLRP
jgi:hypothetical protein